ncbi:hypothetical protein [Haloplanus aerogenes]|uniref:Uncharacterized protein n=1 Tax=Haloplanus aerogenes TaxID=660522 RepID=A0A3M0CXV7_9EURY|nr:hypothetical protein [Haloplanus aerogenes]AZH23927.1 hypothetical protein DU502_00405 [Haloplanus aerogenes]RMB13310.1 hypothetical protein ATH50_2643 [Haloplanus aerogenes]
MPTHSFESSVILYRSGTLTLSQAARHAGCSEAEMAAAVDVTPQMRVDAGVDAGARSVDPV